MRVYIFYYIIPTSSTSFYNRKRCCIFYVFISSICMTISFGSVWSYIFAIIARRYLSYYDVFHIVLSISFSCNIWREYMWIDKIPFVIPNWWIISQFLIPLCQIIKPRVVVINHIGRLQSGRCIFQWFDIERIRSHLHFISWYSI